MGEYAEMHIEAYEAGLDPNDMDGADWAEFYESNDEPLTDAEAAEEFGMGLRCFPMQTLLLAGKDGDTLTDILCRLFPKITEGQARGFEAVLEIVNGLPDDD